MVADQVQSLPPYTASGTYVSCALDAGRQAEWTSLSWVASAPAGTSLSVSARSSIDGISWSAWVDVSASGAAPGVPNGRYIQYGVTLASSDAQSSPAVDTVTASYQ
jgi:hypothetical protein